MPFTQNPTPTFTKQPQNAKVQIANADGTNVKALYTAGPNGSKMTSIIGTSTDTAAHDVQLLINVGGTNTGGTVSGGTNYLLGTMLIAAGAGNASTTASNNLLDPTHLLGIAADSDGNPCIHLISGDILCVASVVTVTSGKSLNVTAPTVGDF